MGAIPWRFESSFRHRQKPREIRGFVALMVGLVASLLRCCWVLPVLVAAVGWVGAALTWLRVAGATQRHCVEFACDCKKPACSLAAKGIGLAASAVRVIDSLFAPHAPVEVAAALTWLRVAGATQRHYVELVCDCRKPHLQSCGEEPRPGGLGTSPLMKLSVLLAAVSEIPLA